MREGPSGKRFDEQWREIPDDRPVEVPVGMQRPKSMQEMVAMYVANAMALQRKMSGEEEGADVAEDLEVEDEEGDEEILTPYELHAMAANFEAHERRKAWMARNLHGKKGGGAVRGGEERVSGAPGPGSVGPEKGRGEVSGAASDSGASSVRSVESAAGVQSGGPGGKGAGTSDNRSG